MRFSVYIIVLLVQMDYTCTAINYFRRLFDMQLVVSIKYL